MWLIVFILHEKVKGKKAQTQGLWVTGESLLDPLEISLEWANFC